VQPLSCEKTSRIIEREIRCKRFYRGCEFSPSARLACEASGLLAISDEQLHRAPDLDLPPALSSEQGLIFTAAESTGK